MNISIASRSASMLCKSVSGMLTCSTLALFVAQAHANGTDLAEIVVSAPTTKIVGRYADLTPIEKIIIKAHVPFDPATLTSSVGIKRLQERVTEGARRACGAADPGELDDDDTCVRDAVKGAQLQIDRAIIEAQAKQ